MVVGSEDRGRSIVFLRGQTLNHPDRLQIHFAVPDVDTEFERLTRGQELTSVSAVPLSGW